MKDECGHIPAIPRIGDTIACYLPFSGSRGGPSVLLSVFPARYGMACLLFGLPAFQGREEFFHTGNGFLFSEIHSGILVEFVGELCTMFYHFVHSAVLCKIAVLVAIGAIFLVEATVGIGSEYFCR